MAQRRCNYQAIVVLLVGFCTFICSRAAWSSNVPEQVVIPISKERVATNYSKITHTSFGTSAYVVITTQEWSIVWDHRLEVTSRQSEKYNCVFAGNGGPFNADGSPSGALIIKGSPINNTIEEVGASPSFVGFGTTQNDEWIMGTFSQVQDLSLWNFVTGFGWLVYEGLSIANNNVNPTGADRAARTAVGVDSKGFLFIVVADGCEHCLRASKRGPTLEELGQLLVDMGIRYAINMDGGGSSTLVHKRDGVINRPTCLGYLPVKCQRPVASVMCIGGDDSRPTMNLKSVQ
jgi:exopolysaccharide biosynthesis protein